MNNIYNSRYLETVKNDEYKRSTNLYNKSKNPLKTGIVPLPANSSMFHHINHTDNKTLTGITMNKENFRHNNMQPYLKGNITQNTNTENFTQQMNMHTGIDKFYKQKKEVENIFKPTPFYQNINGEKSHTDYLKSRIELPKINNNVSPFEKVYVGPGINKGYTSEGTGGFQQIDINDYARPKTLDELRTKVNQKNSYFDINYQAPIKGTDQRGIVSPYIKNKPEKTYSQTEDNWFKTTSSVLKPKNRPEYAIKKTSRPDSHIEYTGIAKLENIRGLSEQDDYGKKNIIVYDNERKELETKTVVSNITSTVKAIISPLLDALKYTNKEYLVESARAGGNPRAQIPSKGEVIDDNMKTTVKETTLHDSDITNLSGPDGTYSALNDDLKTTVKETLIHDTEKLNIKAGDKTYIKNEDKMKTTNKETLPLQDTVRNIGNNTYRVCMYEPDNVAKTTVKETTIKGSSDMGFIGGVINSILGGYATKELDIKNTNRQFTSDNEEYGIAKSINDYRQTSREAEANAEINGAREKLLMDAGHTPNKGGMNIPIDKSNIAMKTNKIIEDSYSARETGNVNVIYQIGPELNECSITRDNDVKNAYENRLDGVVLDSLKSNDFNININPIIEKSI